MKKKLFLYRRTAIIFFFFISIFSGCKNKVDDAVKEPEQIGKHAFDILRNFSETTEKEFIEKFISLREYDDVVKNTPGVGATLLGNTLSITEENWKNRIKNDYRTIKELGIEDNIKWKDIEYQKFDYTEKTDGGLTFYGGKMFFNFNGKSYYVKVGSVLSKEEYKLVKLSMNYS